MKPAAFEYHAPTSVSAMLDLLAELGNDGKVIAGGQSLVPAMNFRLARPAHLFDANGLAELDYLRVSGEKLVIGALTRHAAFHEPVVDDPLGRLLSHVVRHIAHYPIRQRGTFAGSLAHADPAAEWCLAAAALDAEIVARSRAAERVFKGGEFFRGTFTTQLRADELITEIRLPLLGRAWHAGFSEYSRRAGDFALGMTLAAYKVESGRIVDARIGVGGVVARPIRLQVVENALVGRAPDASAFAQAAEIARESVDPMEDIHATSAYRRDLMRATTRRALEKAASA